MQYDVEINDNWQPLRNIDIKKSGIYLKRYIDKTYKNCISILVITDNTWHNGLWIFLDGDSRQINDWMLDNCEVCGPIKFN